MNLRNRVFLPVTLTLIGVLYSSLEAKAEIVTPAARTSPSTLSAEPQLALQTSTRLPQFVEASTPSPTAVGLVRSGSPVSVGSIQLASIESQATGTTLVPLPGSSQTTASSLLAQPIPPLVEIQPADGAASGDRRVAQDIAPGRATRSGSSYFGVGGNIGILGDSTAVGDGSFAILSKIGLTDRFSFRPAVLFGGDVTFLLPVTYDFSSVGSVGSYSVAPYVGGGFAINTGGDDTFNLLGTAGVDIPLGSQFTVNAAFNVTFLNDVSFGLLLGLGYNF